MQGNADALAGEVALERPGHELAEGVFGPEGFELGDLTTTPPVLIGAGCELGEGANLHGPIVLGDGARVGAGAMARDAVILPGAELGPGAVIVGGVYGLSRVDSHRPNPAANS